MNARFMVCVTHNGEAFLQEVEVSGVVPESPGPWGVFSEQAKRIQQIITEGLKDYYPGCEVGTILGASPKS